MGSSSSNRNGIFNVKTVQTEDAEEDREQDLQESRVVESPIVTRFNFLNKGKDFPCYDEFQRLSTSDRTPVNNNHEPEFDQVPQYAVLKKKSMERIHQSSPKKHPMIPMLSSPSSPRASKKFPGGSTLPGSQISTGGSPKDSKDQRVSQAKIDSILERKSTVELERSQSKTYPHISLSKRQGSPKRKIGISLKKNISPSLC